MPPFMELSIELRLPIRMVWVPTPANAGPAGRRRPGKLRARQSKSGDSISKVLSAYICEICKIWTSAYFAYFCIFLHIMVYAIRKSFQELFWKCKSI